MWLAAPDAPWPDALPVAPTHAAVTPLATVLSFYRAANELSLARGRNPDTPQHLNKVTETV